MLGVKDDVEETSHLPQVVGEGEIFVVVALLHQGQSAYSACGPTLPNRDSAAGRRTAFQIVLLQELV